MIIQIFRPPNDGEALWECKLGDINDAISLEYEDYFCGVGTFTLELASSSPFASAITENALLYCKDDDITFVAKNIKETEHEGKIEVTGYTLNCMLLDRLTMERENDVDGAEGKDVFSGTTEACVKHFVDYNLISSPVAERNYARLAVAEDLGRGIAADSNLVGMECVEDVVRTMCAVAKLGYSIKLNIHASSTEPLFIFDVAERVDRSAEQSERNRVVFSVGRKNITALEREVGISAEKNVLWCDTGGENGFVYKSDDDNGEPIIPVSWNRREEFISLSVTDAYNWEEIELYARKEMADKFAEVDSLVIDAGNPLEYGSLYSLGDIVTVWDKEKSVQLDSWISVVGVKRTATEHSVKLTLGESKPKLLNGYAKQTDILKKSQRDFPPAEGGEGIEFAIVIDEVGVKHLLHKYTQIGYIANNRMVYGAESNSIVVDGKLFMAGSNVTASNMYAMLEFSNAGSAAAAGEHTIKSVVQSYNESTGIYTFRWEVDGAYLSGNAQTKNMSTVGFYCVWTEIRSPDNMPDLYPNGAAYGKVYTIYENQNGVTTTGAMGTISFAGFNSIAEYRAAIGLTYEPEALSYTIEDNVTEVTLTSEDET